MENQYYIFLVGRIHNVEVDLDGIKTISYFKVIEIMGEKDSYPTLMSIYFQRRLGWQWEIPS
jgi:hypothetical protein